LDHLPAIVSLSSLFARAPNTLTDE
jgi:hypothetical protein